MQDSRASAGFSLVGRAGRALSGNILGVPFEGQAAELENPAPMENISAVSTRAPKYTTLQKLLTAEEYKDL